MEFRKLLKHEIHTDSSIDALRKARRELQRALLAVERGFNNWRISKFFCLRYFERFIPLVASMPYITADSYERQHKGNKAAAAFTNNRYETRGSQVALHAELAAAARRVLQLIAVPKTERTSMMKRAVMEGSVALPSRYVLVSMPQLVARTPEVQALLAMVESLAWLQWSVVQYCEGKRRAPLAEVEIYGTAGLPWYRRLGAPREGAKVRAAVAYKQPNFVAVRAPGYSAETPVEYCAEVLAFVVLRFADGTKSGPLAFIRWYEEDKSADAQWVKDKLHMTPLVVEGDERQNAYGRKVKVDFTDLIDANEIIRLVYVQPNPVKGKYASKKSFLLNPFV